MYTCNHGITYNCPEYDILNTGRPMDDGFDMGAYEWYLGVGVQEEQSAVGGQRSAVEIYPNPFAGVVNCQLSIVNCQSVSLKIYDIHGREVATVLDGVIPAGEHTVQFDTFRLPAGIYMYRLTANGQRQTGKLVKF